MPGSQNTDASNHADLETTSNEMDSSCLSTPLCSPTITESQYSPLDSPAMSLFTTSTQATVDENVLSLSAENLLPAMATYKLVGDNLDKNVRTQDMRSDHQTQSFHFFHTYAVKDK